jgi:hypothetical protein
MLSSTPGSVSVDSPLLAASFTIRYMCISDRFFLHSCFLFSENCLPKLSISREGTQRGSAAKGGPEEGSIESPREDHRPGIGLSTQAIAVNFQEDQEARAGDGKNAERRVPAVLACVCFLADLLTDETRAADTSHLYAAEG